MPITLADTADCISFSICSISQVETEVWSTWDIEQMLKEMQSAVSASVMGMDKFSEEIRRSCSAI